MRQFRKNIILIGVSVLFFLGNWIVTAKTNLYGLENLLPTLKDVLLWFMDSFVGYNGIRSTTFVYAIFFLLILYKYKMKEESYVCVRMENRVELFKRHLKDLGIISFVFSFSHGVVNMILMSEFFSVKFLLEEKFYISIFLHMIMLMLFYIRIGILTQILSDSIFGKTFSYFFVFAFVYIEGSSLITVEKVVNWWSPILDLQVSYQFLKNEISYLQIILTYVRQISLVLLLAYVSWIVFQRKDLSINETK